MLGFPNSLAQLPGTNHVLVVGEWNNHYVGGNNFFKSDCGVHDVFNENCSGNWFDSNCDRWHERYPNVGRSKNDTLNAPGIIPFSKSATSVSATLATSLTGTVTQPRAVNATVTLPSPGASS